MGDATQNEINYLLAWRAAEWRDYYKNEYEAQAVMMVACRPDLLNAANSISTKYKR